MDLDSPAGTVLLGAIVFALIGLLTMWIAGSRAAWLIGVRTDALWWFAPAGARTQGLVVAYLGLLVAVGALAFGLVQPAVDSFLGDEGGGIHPLSVQSAWITPLLVVLATGTRFVKHLVNVATDGQALLVADVDPAELVQPDGALDDVDVASARTAALAGDWHPAAELLAATADHDVRWDRVGVLAEAALVRRSWLDDWLRERPEDATARTVQAMTYLRHGWELRGAAFEAQNIERFLAALDDAEATARRAAALDAKDPSPLAVLVELARGQQVDRDEFTARLDALREMSPRHLGGHEAALQYLCDKWFGSAEEMFAFAREGAERARPGDAIALLVVTAHLEHAAALGHRSRRAAERHLTSLATRTEIAEAVGVWKAGPGGPSPVRAAQSHNLLAYVGWLAKDADLAAEHLAATHEHLSPWPWEYEGGDVAETHEAVRRWARAKSATD
ncbi:hypothetical protein L1785_18350 [Antribacter sp. KLBMP9083]|uniref:Uncharacterized protein n=1 Tax=Antribacter soli TaxID=2910976 RepID=A0AA41U8P6_9MICO|nr:hypothetical protein [Antribacter soli]MCF4122941.1 hypothetical protein [Antribacter soli]